MPSAASTINPTGALIRVGGVRPRRARVPGVIAEEEIDRLWAAGRRYGCN